MYNLKNSNYFSLCIMIRILTILILCFSVLNSFALTSKNGTFLDADISAKDFTFQKGGKTSSCQYSCNYYKITGEYIDF